MIVDIPPLRIRTMGVPRPILYSGEQEGVLGGETLRTPRPGDRFGLDLGTDKLLMDSASRLLIAALTEATTADARIAIMQPNLNTASIYDEPEIDGAGQAGTSLAVRGIAPGRALKRGQFVTLTHTGRGYLHMLTADTIAVDGEATLSLWPMLRFISADGDPVNISAPTIEGRLVGFRGATFVRTRVEPLSFSIEERA